MPTKQSWLQKIKDYARNKNISLLETHLSKIGKMYEDNQNVEAVFNLLKERSGYKLGDSDYRELKKILR